MCRLSLCGGTGIVTEVGGVGRGLSEGGSYVREKGEIRERE